MLANPRRRRTLVSSPRLTRTHPSTNFLGIISLQQHRGAGPSSILRSLSAVSHLPYTLPSSVSCKSFACHFYANSASRTVLRDEDCRRVHQQPHSGTCHSALTTLLNSFRFTPLRNLLHLEKNQLFYFQSIPHSLPKTPGWGKVAC